MTSNEPLIELPFLCHMGLVITYKCQVACPHCLLEAGPQRTEEMELSAALDWMAQLATYAGGRIKLLSLTGGEPFYDLERLRTLAACALPFSIAVCTADEAEPRYQALLQELQSFAPPDAITPAITFAAGRARRKLLPTAYPATSVVPQSACSSANAPIVFPDGRVTACIGPVIDLPGPHPLVLGNAYRQPLATILAQAERNPVLHALRVWGPHRLLVLATQAGLRAELPQTFIKGSICDVCYQLLARAPVVKFLTQLSCDTAFRRKVAYARAYYLHESPLLAEEA